MDLSIIIVNWNSAHYTTECIHSVWAFTTDIDLEIIVVDNASTDDSCRILHNRFPDLDLICSPENLGFARANNLGFEHCSGRNVLFLNPDTELRGPAINLMLKCIQSLPDVGALGCKLLNSDSSMQTSCIQRFPTVTNQFFDCEYLRKLAPKLNLWGMRPLFENSGADPIDVEAVSGACLMIRRDAFERVGGFNPEYFMYTEDLDLCYKLRNVGIRVAYLGTATVVHHGGQSSKKRGGEDFSAPLLRDATLRFLQMTRGERYALFYRAAVFIAAVVRIIILRILLTLPVAGLDKDTVRSSFVKWRKILRWSIGAESWDNRLGRQRKITATASQR